MAMAKEGLRDCTNKVFVQGVKLLPQLQATLLRDVNMHSGFLCTVNVSGQARYSKIFPKGSCGWSNLY